VFEVPTALAESAQLIPICVRARIHVPEHRQSPRCGLPFQQREAREALIAVRAEKRRVEAAAKVCASNRSLLTLPLVLFGALCDAISCTRQCLQRGDILGSEPVYLLVGQSAQP